MPVRQVSRFRLISGPFHLGERRGCDWGRVGAGCAVREAVHAEVLLPDARPRHAMGAFELLRSIRSEEVKDLTRELAPNLRPDLAE